MKILHDVVADETRKHIRDKLYDFGREVFTYVLETLPDANKNATETSAESHVTSVGKKLAWKPSCWAAIWIDTFSANELGRSSLDCCSKTLTFIAMKNTLPQGIGILLDFDEVYENLPSAEKDCHEVGAGDLLNKLEQLDSARAKVGDILASLPEAHDI